MTILTTYCAPFGLSLPLHGWRYVYEQAVRFTPMVVSGINMPKFCV